MGGRRIFGRICVLWPNIHQIGFLIQRTPQDLNRSSGSGVIEKIQKWLKSKQNGVKMGDPHFQALKDQTQK